ncbi:alpha/beta hydrolase family protein [Pacificimonas flava]|uniref:Prolyl oligopeptidase family protein n=1 Tax=Pacificimonas flava TaxID=1234595 RepID=M2T691_9SPHN|nr:S9 family peptidase [Pacificimonas flava]EMD82019.1 prolyl oligopeptidase family protein [Pacificimonas flava]MBB5280419.1 dipeptidyl aminopeptidase/acylaminoacyl peptidase [Pacificimonas flava]
MKILSTAATLFLAATSLAAPASARPFTADDLAGLNRLGDSALSPDGNTLVFSMRETDFEANRGRTDLFRLDLSRANATPQRWLADPESDSSPVFSADGTAVYWLSGRSGDAQVWRAPLSDGEPMQITRIEDGISGFHLSPTDDRVVYWKTVSTPDDAAGSGMVYDRLFVRQWDTWTDGDRQQIFSLALGANGTTGDPVALSADLTGNVPTLPFGGGEDVAFSPDGRTIYFVMREATPDEAWSTNTDIYAVPADGSAAAENLTADAKGYDRNPVPSPDGRYLAYLSMETPGYESDQAKLMLRDLQSGEVRAMSANRTMSVDNIVWGPDSESMIIGRHEGWNARAHWMDLDTRHRLLNLPEGAVSVVDYTEDGVLFSRSSLTEPGDLYWLSGNSGSDVRRLTAINAEKLEGVEFSEVERFNFSGAQGHNVFGYAVKPAGLAEGAVAPTVLWSHGGPQGQWSNAWSTRWNPMVWAGQGYAIVTVDFHGSSGYSQDFTDSIQGDWGGKPLKDLQMGLAYARGRFPWLDSDKACAAGASYGGYMMNWIEGNWPDEFACIVNHDGLFDVRSMYYSTEELFFPEHDFGGPYFENEELYERWNPVNFVDEWKTPMLVIHGEKDYRVPIEQGLGAFTALQRKGIDSRLLVFPDENHWVLKPNNSLQWHSEIFRWLDEYLKD